MANSIKRKKIRTAVLIASLFFIFFSMLSILRNKYGPKTSRQNDNERAVQINVNGDKNFSDPLPAEWKFCAGDNKSWANINFNDSEWKTLPLFLDVRKETTKFFNGIGWFRCGFKIDSLLINKVFALKLEHLGASEIYLDGKFIGGFGTVSSMPSLEKTLRPFNPLLISITDYGQHTLAVRYSNHSYFSNYKKYDEKQAGIKITFFAEANSFYNDLAGTEIILFWFILLFGFFITLSLVHLLIYLFYRKQIQNLYYSIFVFVYALLALAPYMFMKISNPQLWLGFQQNIIFVFTFFFLSIVACLHSIFKPNLWKKMFILQALLSLIIIVIYFSNILHAFEGTLIFILVLFTIIESVRTVIVGIRKGFPGAGIIGTGVLTFFLFIGILLIDAFITESLGFNLDTSVYLFTLVFISIISIPLSMSIYLARNFALINNDLSQKLNEVQNLSAKSIEQEKEKQHILENQNITLEKQVTERTFEITEQKKIIEEKNKDIIDSINYAKRIQSAMLPDEAAFKTIFNNSFVLYMPRDIVSGDFYYATEINENKLIIAADCTGHGVPGALMSMVGCNIINKLTHENKIIEPKIILETLHTELRQALKQDLNGSVNRDGMDVVAVLINNKNVIYASANRPLIYFDSKNQLQELKATKTPIGGSHIEAVNIEQHFLPIENIKQLYLFSDGFADQFGGPDGKKLMVSKFKLWLNQIINLEVAEQHNFLENNFAAWKKESEQVDDVMVIGIKLNNMIS